MRETKSLFCYLFILAFWAIAASSAFASTSTSYKVDPGALAPAGGALTSTSYKLNVAGSGAGGSGSSTTYTVAGGSVVVVIGSGGSGPTGGVAVTSITPNSGYNSGIINITDLAGSGFQSGATVRLTKSGETDITASAVNVLSSTQIGCKFELTGKTKGDWDVVVSDSTSSTATLASGFKIKSWAVLGQLVNYPNPFNPERGTTSIIYPLAADTNTSIYIFNITNELVWKQDYSAGADGGKAGDNSVSWNGYNNFGELSANGVYFCQVIDRTAKKVIAKGKIAVSR